MMDKQQATFTGTVGFYDYGMRGISAFITGVKGHPKLGDEAVVTTSRVERIGYNDAGNVNVVETKNTVYTRA